MNLVFEGTSSSLVFFEVTSLTFQVTSLTFEITSLALKLPVRLFKLPAEVVLAYSCIYQFDMCPKAFRSYQFHI